MSYLNQVLSEIQRESAAPKTLHAEHLFKLNEAVFNLPEEDTLDKPAAKKLFEAVEKIRKAYKSGKFDNADSNFFYDYLALLGTMQNQHFFSQAQTEKMLSWIREVVDSAETGLAPAGKPSSNSAGMKELEVENEKLRKRLAKYEELKGAVNAIHSFDDEQRPTKSKVKAKEPPVREPPAPSKGSKKGKAVPEEEPPKGKGKGKGKEEKGKGKGKGKEVAEEPPPKSKGKKGKGKGSASDDDDEPPMPKGKGKGKEKGKDLEKGKGKGKGKEPPVVEEPPSKGGKKGKKGKAAPPPDVYEEAPPPKGKSGKKGGKGKWAPVEEEPPPLRAGKGGKGKGKGKESKWQAKAS